ncbi:MAG: iron-sulfur cluster assembly protein [Thermodesulfobacteriota bacterium]
MGFKKIINIINDQDEGSKNSEVSFKKLERKGNENESKSQPITEDQVYDALKTVHDPELPVNIVDLGLIYDINVTPGNNVNLKMTLTTQGCGMGATIAGQAEMAIKDAGANNVLVEIIWDPPWNPDMMSDEARERLGVS